jgi:hypothetical protein
MQFSLTKSLLAAVITSFIFAGTAQAQTYTERSVMKQCVADTINDPELAHLPLKEYCECYTDELLADILKDPKTTTQAEMETAIQAIFFKSSEKKKSQNFLKAMWPIAKSSTNENLQSLRRLKCSHLKSNKAGQLASLIT